MNSNEGRDFVNRRNPASFFGELAQIFFLSFPPNRKRLDDAIGSYGKTIAGKLSQRTQHIGRKNAIVGTLFHDFEIDRPPQLFPNFRKLSSEKFSEERSYTYIGKKIATSADLRPSTGVIPLPGEIDRQPH